MMIRPFTLLCAFFAGISGMVLYAQKHKTTQLDKQITKIVYDTQKVKSQTAMLRTEWTLLNQPDRLKSLSNNFIPGLRPLDPSQFVQMAGVVSVLPPVQQDPDKDKTREQLVQNVAQSHGQQMPANGKEPPIIIAQDTNTSQPQSINQKDQKVADDNADNSDTPLPVTQPKKLQKAQVADIAKEDSVPDVKPTKIKKQNTVIAQDDSDQTAVTVPPPPVRTKKTKSVDVASNGITKTPAPSPQQTNKKIASVDTSVKANTTIVPPSAHRKKAKPVEVADASNDIDSAVHVTKKNHIENVSYNIQSGNPFSHNKTAKPKQTVTNSDTNAQKTASNEKKPVKKIPQNTITVSKRQAPIVKVAKNEAKKSNSSESALGGGGDALPAPVPFAP